MPIIPEFREPGDFLRHFGPSVEHPQRDPEKKFRYILLQERMAPLKYPYTFASVASGEKSDDITFDELQPDSIHIYEAYLGVKPGARIFIWHPYDEKILKWDTKIEDIAEDYTANITHEESPHEAPVFSIWIKRDAYPLLSAMNITWPGKSIKPEIIWLTAMFNFMEITNGELLDKLEKRKIPSTPISFGGAIG